MVAERETVVVGQDAGSMDFADRGGDLRTEDLTMDAIDVMVNGTGEGLVSPGRQHLVDDILPGHGERTFCRGGGKMQDRGGCAYSLR